MATFADILNKINTGAQIALAINPAIQQFGQDHIVGTQEILQVAGAGVAAESNDPQVQQEAQAAASLASALTPLVFGLFSLFHHKKPPSS